MAGEEIFTANAVLSGIAIFVLLVLYVIADLVYRNRLWKRAWLFGIFLVLSYAFSVQFFGLNAVGAYDERDAAGVMLTITAWATYFVTVMIFITVLYDMFRWLAYAVTGNENYLPPEEKWHGKKM